MSGSGGASLPAVVEGAEAAGEAAGGSPAQTTGFVSRLAMDAGDRADWQIEPARMPSGVPALSLAIITCMDARLDLATRLGLAAGDAHILRNAGGRVTPDVLRSLRLSVGLMSVREIGIVHHTSCAVIGTDDETLRRALDEPDMDFCASPSLDVSLPEDVGKVLSAGILPAGGVVWGAVYNLNTERITVVHGPVVVLPQSRRPRSRRDHAPSPA